MEPKRIRGLSHSSFSQWDDIYETHRGALMKRHYYGHRLHFYRNANLTFEIVLTLATSGAVSTWTFWNTALGRATWSAFAGFAAVMCLLKPILQLSKSIERYSNLYKGYSILYFDLSHLVQQTQASQRLSAKLLASFEYAQTRYRSLSIDDDLKRIERIWTKCRALVDSEVDKPFHPPMTALRTEEEPLRLAKTTDIHKSEPDAILYGIA